MKPKSLKELIKSKELKQLHDLSVAITRKGDLTIKYSEQAKTSFITPKKNRSIIVLSLQPYPERVRKYPRIARRVLDGDLLHELGHKVLTFPYWDRFNRWEKSKKFPKLAHTIENIMEDKRVNHFMIQRYRFSFGQRLQFANDLLKEMWNHALKEGKIQQALIMSDMVKAKNKVGAIMLSIMVNEGLYEGNCKLLWKELNQEQRKDMKELMTLLDEAKYLRIKHTLIQNVEKMYQLIEKHIVIDKDFGDLLPRNISEGIFIFDISPEFEESLADEEEAEEKAEEEAKKLEKDLKKGGGAGKGTGDEIPAPEPDSGRYIELCQKNANEIQRLLNKLKKFVVPTVTREIFQKRGRFMNPLLAKAYVNSRRREVRRVYMKSNVAFEKQKVAIQILIDYSGSMDIEESNDCCTILNEVFGRWVEDSAYGLLVFGSDYQKIKTFFEPFETTRNRIGGISCNMGGTEASEPLEAILAMFQSVPDERAKVLIFVSDFCLGDESESIEQLKALLKENVFIILVGLCDSYVNGILPEEKRIYRTTIHDVTNLPELFCEIYEAMIFDQQFKNRGL